MKKILFILFGIFQIYSVTIEALPHEASTKESRRYWETVHNLAEKWWDNMPNWKEDFFIDNGSATIHHDENGISIVSNLVQSFDQEDNDDEISQYQVPCKEIYLTQWQGKTFRYPLRLKWHSSRADFVNELIRVEFVDVPIRSKFYKGTANEQQMYQSSFDWWMSCSVIGLPFEGVDCNGEEKTITSIEHKPKEGIIFLDQNEYRVSMAYDSVKLYDLNGRKLYLHHWQSPYEFMMRLIETGHVSFSQYPAYTIQEKISISWPERKPELFYECYYYGLLTKEDNPSFIRFMLEQEAKRKRKRIEALKREVAQGGILKASDVPNQGVKSSKNVHFAVDVTDIDIGTGEDIKEEKNRQELSLTQEMFAG